MDTYKKYFENQRKIIKKSNNYEKFNFIDINRLEKHIIGDIFGQKCCRYIGTTKNNYMTFSLNSKKLSLLRAIYHNYVDDIELDDTIVNICGNQLCCNLSHFKVLKPNDLIC